MDWRAGRFKGARAAQFRAQGLKGTEALGQPPGELTLRFRGPLRWHIPCPWAAPWKEAAMEHEFGWLCAPIALGVLLSSMGSALWWVVVFLAARRALAAAPRNLDRTLPELEALLQTYKQLPLAQREGQQAQIVTMMARANKELLNLDENRRQRYEGRVGEMASIAASAGIFWTPPGY
jgi:hypothetical protein